MADKVKTVAEVVQSIPDGSHIGLGGFAINRNPIVFAHELIRQRKKNLTVSQGVAGLDTELLVGAGLVSTLIFGGGSLDRFGPIHCVNRVREDNSVTTCDCTTLSICFRYLAGSLGISFIPIKSLLASDILHRLESSPLAADLQHMKCPFTGEEYILLRALSPDVAVIHVQVADREGNSQIVGPKWDNEEQAKAAKRIVVVAEEIVATEYIQRDPDRTVLPGHRVEAVIHQPFGAYPTTVFRCYDYDSDHLRLFVQHSKRGGWIDDYLQDYVLAPQDFWGYLEKAGGLKRLSELKADGILGY